VRVRLRRRPRQSKRPNHGRIAARLANHVIVTDDNPASERPETIRARDPRRLPRLREIGDRAERSAPARACWNRGPTAHRRQGHEMGQIVGSTVLPLPDHEAVAPP